MGKIEHVKVYYECKEPFKSLKCLWVRSKSITAIWLEKVVTPLIVPAIKGFAAASAVLKPEHLKVDKHERVEVYYECKEPFKSLKCLWVRSKSIDAIWLEKVVTPLIVPAIKGFVATSAVLKPERLKVDKHGEDSRIKSHLNAVRVNTAQLELLLIEEFVNVDA
nr:hypothetical protein [Tanacetum cinerariifolium]